MRVITHLLICLIPAIAWSDNIFNVLDYGAKVDPEHDSQLAFQAAIDAASEAGGGTVKVPAGEYLISGVNLKSNITFLVTAGATIFGSKNLKSYPSHSGSDQHGNAIQRKYLIALHEVENVTICGMGTIDGQGLHYWEDNPPLPQWIRAKPERPQALLEVSDSKNVAIRDITLTNSPNWTCHILHCENVVIDGIKIQNSLFAPNADGIDITGSRLVRVSNCEITTCDDAIVLKTWKNGLPCEDIVVTNCTLETLCAALKLGTESYADFRRITFTNCAVRAASRLFAIYVRDGATAENVLVSNIAGSTKAPLVLNRPIQLMVSKRSEASPLGTIQNVFIDGITCETDGRTLITTDNGGTIRNIRMSRIHLKYPFIEDPLPISKNIKSSQFPLAHPDVLGARAAVVAKNVTGLQVRDFSIEWPDKPVPADWRIPVRIINGDFDLKFRHKYDPPKQADLAVLWGKQLVQGRFDISGLSSSSNSINPFDLQDSSIQLVQD